MVKQNSLGCILPTTAPSELLCQATIVDGLATGQIYAEYSHHFDPHAVFYGAVSFE